MDGTIALLWQIQQLKEPGDPAQPELDAETVKPLQIGECFLIIHDYCSYQSLASSWMRLSTDFFFSS